MNAPTFELSQQQKDEYFGRGYTSVQAGVSPDLLKRLQEMAKKFEENIMDAHKNRIEVHGACIVEDPVGHRLMRYNDIFATDVDTTLDLLASPAIMAIFRDICGRNAVPLQMDIVYKHQHSHPVVLWHQDALHSRSYPYLNVGVYLDDSKKGDGCLSCVKNTQHEIQNIHNLSQTYGWKIPGVEELSAKAGDINIHDMMILHGSEPKRTSGVRRTIYIEIRPYEGIVSTGAQSYKWAELRRRFMGLVLRRANTSDWPQEWKVDYPTDLKTDEEEIEKILQRREPSTGAHYAISSVEHENYPVPADMRE